MDSSAVRYSWRALSDRDTPAWSRLTEAVAATEGSRDAHPAEELAELLRYPGIDPATDTVGVWALEGDGEPDSAALAAVGMASRPERMRDGSIDALFTGSVHPDFRGRGLGSCLLDRLQARGAARVRARFAGEAASWVTAVERGAAASRELLAGHGYRPTRYFTEMIHDLSTVAIEAIGAEASAGRREPRAREPESHTGERLVGYTPDREVELHRVHTESFAEHWGFVLVPLDEWAVHTTRSQSFRPTESVLALGGDGRIEGYALAYRDRPGEAYLGQVGVRPDRRGRGLAGRMLRAVGHRAGGEGCRSVRLHVDSENADGAVAVYERAGFHDGGGEIAYRRAIPTSALTAAAGRLALAD